MLNDGRTGPGAGRSAPATPRPGAAPHGVDAACLGHLVGYRIAQADIPARRAFDRHIGQPLGLPPVAFTILVLVAFNPGVTARQLSQLLSISAPKMTIVLDRLAGKGWLERVRSRTDRRAQNLHLTVAGREQARRAWEISKSMEQQMLRHLSPAERAMLLELLQKVSLPDRA